MKKSLIFFFFWPLLASSQAYWDRFETDETDNMNACFWYIPTANEGPRQKLVGYDWVILNPETQFNNPDLLPFLRQNGVKKVLVYNNYLEQPVHFDQIKPWNSRILSELQEKYPQWFLKQINGGPVVFWDKTQMMNISIECPRIGDMIYSEWMAQRVLRDLLVVGSYQDDRVPLPIPPDSLRYDGMLLDNLWSEISWLADKNGGQTLDFNADGIADSPEAMSRRFQAGANYYLSLIRAKTGPDFLIIGNYGSADYLDRVNGKQFENFPDIYQGKKTEEGSFVMSLLNAKRSPGPDIFNSKEGEEWFTLLSSKLIDNVYFAHLQNTPFKPEYKSLNLGRAVSPLNEYEGVYFRGFENGAVYVNPADMTGWILYRGNYKRDDFFDYDEN